MLSAEEFRLFARVGSVRTRVGDSSAKWWWGGFVVVVVWGVTVSHFILLGNGGLYFLDQI